MTSGEPTSMLKKTAVAAAVTALALPAAAIGDKPENPGSKGKGTSQAKKFKGVGFALSGLDYKGPALTDSKEPQTVGAFTVDVTSANKHARTFLGLTTKPSKETPAQDRPISDTADGKAIVRLVGFETGDVVDATDRVKVIGKVTRVRKGDSTTTRKLDIRRITIKDVEPAPAPAPTA